MAKRPTLEEIQQRVRESLVYYGGLLPRDAALAWSGYFTALIEWDLISVDDHAKLEEMVPRDVRPEGNDYPVLHIFLGWADLTGVTGP
jgi:hypothetical protein